MAAGESFFKRVKKARFDHVYNLPDCRAYYQAVAPLDYQNPAHAVPIARAALAEHLDVPGPEMPALPTRGDA